MLLKLPPTAASHDGQELCRLEQLQLEEMPSTMGDA
jgi:hypothetical protein